MAAPTSEHVQLRLANPEAVHTCQPGAFKKNGTSETSPDKQRMWLLFCTTQAARPLSAGPLNGARRLCIVLHVSQRSVVRLHTRKLSSA